jgi:hypothetical protein
VIAVNSTAALCQARAVLTLLLLFSAVACNDLPPPAETPPTENMPMTQPPLDQAVTEPVEQLAIDDLTQRLDVTPSSIEVVSAQAVTWSDGSLGCPEPDRMYTQALVEGFQVVLSVNGEAFHYHAGDNGKPFLCPEGRRRVPIGAGRAAY